MPFTGEGKRRRYRPEAVDVLRFIAERANRSENAEVIAEALGRVFPRSIGIAEESQRSNAATQQRESQHNRSEPPAVAAVDVPAILAALVPLADRYVTALERQAAALETLAARLPLPGQDRPQDAPKPSKRPDPQGRDETGQDGPHTAPPPGWTRADTLALVHEMRSAGMGGRSIAREMRRRGIPTLSGRGEWAAGAVKRILKGEIKE